MATTKTTKKTVGKRSDNATKGAARAPHRSLFYAMGYTDEELERPLVGVCCAKNEKPLQFGERSHQEPFPSYSDTPCDLA